PASLPLSLHDALPICERDYRSPLAMLRRLGRSNLFLTLDGRRPAPAVTGSRLAALVTGHVTRVFDGDRRAAIADAVTRVARALRSEEHTSELQSLAYL